MIITALDETEKDRDTVIRSQTFKNTPYIDDLEREKKKKGMMLEKEKEKKEWCLRKKKKNKVQQVIYHTLLVTQ